ncbi:MAG TPA: BTAD domain-containing putative transcriptional regulator, partial [Candidatus Limnocylindrales bacterium]|nr:BTAD domain-containing putative transcriptional regulator [Candidatus Limnocylindrales bacterium]
MQQPTTYEFRLLGPLEVLRDGEHVALGPPKQRNLLAALLLHANQVISTDRATDLLWEADPPPSATANIRSYCLQLRRALSDPSCPAGSRLITRRARIMIEVRAGELDLAEFESLAFAGRAAANEGALIEAASLLTQAIDVWRGSAAADLPRWAGLATLLAALDDQRGDVIEELARLRLALGQHSELVAELRREVAANPLRERLWAMLMVAQYRCGDAAGALATYGRARSVIAEQLGVEPGPDLAATHRAVLAHDRTALNAEAVTGPATMPPREIPLDTPSFVGRKAELVQVLDALRPGGGPAPLVIHGAGGVGKSALAVHAAHAVMERFSDGQLYADLHAATAGIRPAEPAAVLGRFLRALGMRPAEVPTDLDEAASRFRSLTATRRVLMVLDNAADEAQVRPLLPAGPQCAVIVTSRHTMAALETSHRLELGALSKQDAVALLGLLGGQKPAGEEHTDELARVCECLPLALRIVGARLASRPDRPLGALVSELRDERRRLDGLQFGDLAVRACFEVSYQAVAEEPAGRLFRLLALLRVPTFDPAVAAALLEVSVADAEKVLDRLIGARLLDKAAPTRYKMHDLLRLFATERLAFIEPAPARQAAMHSALTHFLSTVRRATELLRPNELQRSSDDFQATASRVPLKTAAEAAQWLEIEWPSLLALAAQVADDPEGEARFVVELVKATTQYLPMRGLWADLADLSEMQQRVAVRLGDRQAELRSLIMLAVVRREQGDHKAAVRLLEQVLVERQAIGDQFGIGPVLAHLGLAHARGGNLREALRCFDRSVSNYRCHGRRAGEGIARYEAGEVLMQLGDYHRAVEYLNESLAIRRAEADLVGEGITLVGLGKARCRLGRAEEGVRLLTEALGRCRETGARDYEWQALLWRGYAHSTCGRGDRAVDDLTEALEVCRGAENRRG